MENLTRKQRRELRRQEKLARKENEQKKKTLARAVFWIIAIVVILGAVFGMAKLASRSPNSENGELTASAITPADQVQGNHSASTILIEYSDFQCPACAAYYPMVKRLNEDFGDRLAIAYRHFPLPQHQNAPLAAQASEAAGAQGKFWEMHDMIFDNQREWSESQSARAIFTRYAESLKLDMDKFRADIDSKKIEDKVASDYASGQRANISGTPTFFLNGSLIANPENYEALKNIVARAIEENS